MTVKRLNSTYDEKKSPLSVYYCGFPVSFSIPACMLPHSERERINAIGNERKRNISAAVYLLLSYAAFKEKVSYELSVLRTDKGKPYIKGNPFYFSYSHTSDSAVLVISRRLVGIDLEKPRTYNSRVAKRVCTENEFKIMEAEKDREKRERLFCKMWVAKEAYAKMTGNGFSEGFSSIDTLTNICVNVFFKENTGEFIGIAKEGGVSDINITEAAYDELLQNNPKIYNSF